MAKSCLVSSSVTYQNLMVILAKFWSGHYGQILPLRLPMNLTRFWSNSLVWAFVICRLAWICHNLAIMFWKIMVRSLWPNSCMLEPLQTWQDFATFLGKIISWPNLARYLGRIRCEPWKDSCQSKSCKAILAFHPRYFHEFGNYF